MDKSKYFVGIVSEEVKNDYSQDTSPRTTVTVSFVVSGGCILSNKDAAEQFVKDLTEFCESKSGVF